MDPGLKNLNPSSGGGFHGNSGFRSRLGHYCPRRDKDNKVCEEGVKLMAEPPCRYHLRPPAVVERVPKGETRRVDPGMGREADASAAVFPGIIFQERAP